MNNQVNLSYLERKIQYMNGKHHKNRQSSDKVFLSLVLGYSHWILDCRCHISIPHYIAGRLKEGLSDELDVHVQEFFFHSNIAYNNQTHILHNAKNFS